MHYNLDNLRIMCDGDKDFENTMIEVFVNTIPQSIAIFEQAHQSSDIDKINKEAHKIKTSVRMFSIVELEDDILILEKFSLDNSSQKSLDTHIEKLLKILSVVVKDLRLKEIKA